MVSIDVLKMKPAPSGWLGLGWESKMTKTSPPGVTSLKHAIISGGRVMMATHDARIALSSLQRTSLNCQLL